MRRTGAEYHDLGRDHFDRLNQRSAKDRLVKRLSALGYKVTLEICSLSRALKFLSSVHRRPHVAVG